jgi:leucyl-tRNA synthetase
MGVPRHDDRDHRFAVANGLPISEAPLLRDDEVEGLGRPAVRYRLRDWLISRQRYWGPPIPIIHCGDCGTLRVPDEDLPVLLPYVRDFRPTGTGLSPLAAVAEWVETTCPQCGGPARRETDVSDTFVDSSWYYLRYPSTEFDDRPWDAIRTARVLPVDFYGGGPEHVQRHHLYARFVTMALNDLGLVPFTEPFPRIRLGGMIVKDGAKMSKSRGNVITPDEYLERHGADVLRGALLFSAPWQQGGEFTDQAITGIERFFAKAWRAVTAADAAGPDEAALSHYVDAVTTAIEAMSFNVALARLMELVTVVGSPRSKRVFVKLLAPLAPHLAEELWHQLGEPFSVHTAPWPRPAGEIADSAAVQIAVQVDGRLRGVLDTTLDAGESEVVAAAREAVSAAPQPGATARVVYVPGRVINFVTG